MGTDERRLITSPAGETIEVVSDDDWAKLNGWPTHAPLNNPQRGRDAVIKALWEHGAYEDASGLAGSRLYADAKTRGYSASQVAMSSIFRGALAVGTDRTIRGKRQYRIALTALPESWANQLLSANGDRPEVFADDETNATEQNDSVPVQWPDAPAEQVGLAVAQAVATSLLAQVVDIVSTGKPDQTRLAELHATAEARQAKIDQLQAERDSVAQRLATALEYGQRQARELRQVGDELAAVKHERDGLRQRLRLAEANLTAAMRNERGDVIRDAVNDELGKLMRTAPAHRSADDADTFRPPTGGTPTPGAAPRQETGGRMAPDPRPLDERATETETP